VEQGRREPSVHVGLPPPQHRLAAAAEESLALLRRLADGPDWPDRRAALGVESDGARCVLSVLEDRVTVDLRSGAVCTADARPVSPWWRVLVLHYLTGPLTPSAGDIQRSLQGAGGTPNPIMGASYEGAPKRLTGATQRSVPAVTFADLPGGRTYAPVYQGRVIERLVRTVGREREPLRRAALALGALEVVPDPRPLTPGGLALDFPLFPRVRLRLVWYPGDEEFGPSAVLLLPRDIETHFTIEDIVVLSERLVARLGGGTF
jgi:hypothetical protein